MSRQSHVDAELAGGIFKLSLLMLAILLVGLLLCVWLIVKAGHLVSRVLITHPDSTPVWITLGVFFLSLVVLLLARGAVLAIAFCALSLTVLLATARIVELYYAELCQPKREPLIEEILKKPWWPAVSQDKQAA